MRNFSFTYNKHNKGLGKLGEEAARKFLENKNYKILGSNFVIRGGEIDIIALRSDNSLRFIEVKTRSDEVFSDVRDTVNFKKVTSLFRASREWLNKNTNWKLSYGYDFIGVVLSNSKLNCVEIIQDFISKY